MGYVELAPAQAFELLTMLGEDPPEEGDRYGLITYGDAGGALRVSIASLSPSGAPQYFWTGAAWAPL